MLLNRRSILLGAAGLPLLSRPASAQENPAITLALQEGGTAAWEIAAMRAAGLDAANGITVAVREVADSRAGQVALQAEEIDAILSDFVWVSSQRNAGADFAFVPHSLAVGGLLAPAGGAVQSVTDLEGKRLAVAGGPLDKSYIFLQAHFNFLTGKQLPELVTADFGAPPLVNEMLATGQTDAALNFWHFAVRAKLAGAVEVISVKDMLAAMGVSRQPPLVGWSFSEKTAAARPEAFQRFLDASFATKHLLLAQDDIWTKIRPKMRGAEDDALFAALREGYRAGIVTSYGAEDVQAATEAYALIARFGGAEAIGDVPDLAPGTFWGGYSK